MFETIGRYVANAQNRFDRWQQGVPVVAFPISVWLRSREDRCYEYSALLSYYGFFSIFPLLTVVVTIVGLLLPEYPALREELLSTFFAKVPVVGESLAREIDGLEGNGAVLLVAIGFTLWAGIGVVRVAQDAFNTMWSVSIMRWPSFFPKLLRALAALVVIGGAFLLATVFSAVATFAYDLPGLERLTGVLVAIAVNALMLLLVFKVLTVSDVGWRSLVPGALAGGVAMWVVQFLGGVYVNSVILGASNVYGTFATALGLLVWLALVNQVLLLAAEVNVVLQKRLWPRSIEGKNLTEADERSFQEVRTRSIRKPQASNGESGLDDSGDTDLR